MKSIYLICMFVIVTISCTSPKNEYALCLLDNFTEGSYFLCIPVDDKKVLIIENTHLFYICNNKLGWDKEMYIQKLTPIIRNDLTWVLPKNIESDLINNIVSISNEKDYYTYEKKIKHDPLILNRIKDTSVRKKIINYLFQKKIFIYRDDLSGRYVYNKNQFKYCSGS